MDYPEIVLIAWGKVSMGYADAYEAECRRYKRKMEGSPVPGFDFIIPKLTQAREEFLTLFPGRVKDADEPFRQLKINFGDLNLNQYAS